MSDIELAYNQIADFLHDNEKKTLLLCGIADHEKHLTLLRALNSNGPARGVIMLIYTTREGMRNFFEWAELKKVKIPKKYGETMKLSKLTISFDKLSLKEHRTKYDNQEFDFIIIWPIQSVTKNADEIQVLKEMAERQKTKKIIYLTVNEPWCNPQLLKPNVDCIIQVDCKNDSPEEYQRIMKRYEEDVQIEAQYHRF